MQSIDAIRVRINAIDKQILLLLEERTTIAKDIAAYKYTNGLSIVDIEREKEILSGVPEQFQDIWREIMHVSKQQQILCISEFRQVSNN